jgi:microcystin-dependent protein
MADAPYIGELRLFSGPIPQGWAACDGTLLQIATNQPLYSLIGTTYGGNGQTNFALPDLRGKVGVGYQNGTAYPLGTTGGTAAVTLTPDQMPQHNHTAFASTQTGSVESPSGQAWAVNGNNTNVYSPTGASTMAATALTPGGASQAHNNMQPYLSVTWAICLQGIYPSWN